jgi:hypothetical protein
VGNFDVCDGLFVGFFCRCFFCAELLFCWEEDFRLETCAGETSRWRYTGATTDVCVTEIVVFFFGVAVIETAEYFLSSAK